MVLPKSLYCQCQLCPITNHWIIIIIGCNCLLLNFFNDLHVNLSDLSTCKKNVTTFWQLDIFFDLSDALEKPNMCTENESTQAVVIWVRLGFFSGDCIYPKYWNTKFPYHTCPKFEKKLLHVDLYKNLTEWQTVQTLIRRLILWRLIWGSILFAQACLPQYIGLIG